MQIVTKLEALKVAADLIREAAPRGLRLDHLDVPSWGGDSLSVEVRRGFAQTTTLYVLLRCESFQPRKLDKRSDKLHHEFQARVEVGTSGTTRDVAGSVAYAAQLGEVSLLAAEIQTALAELTIAEEAKAL